MKIDSLQGTLWKATAGPGPEYRPLEDHADTDVAIVGAGYLGLSTALHLADKGIRVVVIEAERPGFGASGRNSGFVVPSFVTSLGPSRVRDIAGSAGDRMCLLVANSGNLVFDLIRERGIECDAEQTGWLQPAHGASRVSFLERRKADWASFGSSLDMLDRRETVRLTGVPSYHAALLDRTGGHLNPLGYAQGLARAATDAGAFIKINAPVLKVEREGRRWAIQFHGGRLAADSVLLATNALDTLLAPRFAKSVIPVVVHQIATVPLNEVNRETILPENHCASDTRRDIFAFRWTRDGRLVTGGMALGATGASRSVRNSFLTRLQSMVSISGPCNVEFGWSGVIAVTRNLLPQVCELESGLIAAVGCCGRGLALSTAIGRELAAFLCTGDRSELSVPVAPPAPIPGKAFAQHLPRLLLPWYRMRDWIESR